MAKFPQTFIDDLRRQSDIVRVVSDYVSLKKKGTNWMACCPFHQEKTPSFSVSPSKEMYYCFGCGKGGNVFSFVMELERVSFPEAIKIVAEKAGVPLPALEEDKRFEVRRRDADAVIELNGWALEWWEQQLKEGDGADVRAAREYVESRGITEETRALFRLGFAPDSWDALGSYLKRKGASSADIERSGLVVKKDAGGFYDRFRGRIIFPVMDAQGRPVAFGGRALPGEGEPKYLNSPETAAYTKGRHLYGLHLSRDEIRRKKFAILVEGYLDLIALFEFGVRNVVASLGTSLTAEQGQLLERFARKVVVNYDGDSAGKKAAKRAFEDIEPFIARGFEIKVLVLPDNADPDEFLRKYGVAEYNKRRGEAPSFIQFAIDLASQGRNLRRASEKADAVEEVLPFIRAVRNTVQKRDYFDLAMYALQVEESVRGEIWQTLKRSAAGAAPAQAIKQKVAQAEAQQPTEAEKILLELLVHDAELRREFLPLVEELDYEDLPTATVFRALKEIEADGADVTFETLTERTASDASAADIVPLLLMGEPQRAEGEASDEVLAKAESCLVALRLMKVDRRLKELAVEIAAAERAGETTRRNELILENLEWTRVRSALNARRAATFAG
ncbi:MAG TPA: DNA primase [Pyrinomonadaceae bacterium]|jgi:DNA primase